MFLIKINKANIITYLSIVFGITSIYFAITQTTFLNISYFNYSLIFLVLAGVCDMFDGKVARMCKRSKEEKQIGIELDSLADTINFLCAPIIIMISIGMNNIFELIIYAIFLICGVSRLAYFNTTTDQKTPIKTYKGMPVTTTAIIYPVLGLLYNQISTHTFFFIYLLATMIIAFLFVYKFNVQKFTKQAYIIIPILAIVLIKALLVVK